MVTAKQAHSLTIDEASRHYPVRLKGVITYYDWLSDPVSALIFLHDQSGSIFATFPKLPHLSLHPGELVSLEGVSGPGRYAPIVERARFRHLGEAPLPRPDLSSFSRMLTGSEDGKWLDVKGVVRSAELLDPWRLVLDVQADIGILRVTLMNFGNVRPAALVDATVLLTGNCAPFFNKNRQLVGARLFVPQLSLVRVLRASPDPFSLPVHKIASLMRYTPDLGEVHRMRVHGTVTLSQSGRVVIQDDRVGTLVEPLAPVKINPGEEVDAVGFPAAGEYASVLSQALIKPTGRYSPIPAIEATPAKVLAGSYDSRLIRIEGRLMDVRSGPLEETLLVSSQGSLVEAGLASDGKAVAWNLRRGSYLQLTGVCFVQVDQDRSPKGFRILLRSQRDVVTLQAPSWWSVAHTLYLFLGTSAITFAVVAWVFVLRRRVAQQTGVIRRQLAEADQLKVKAEAASRAKSEFLANMSHEIRTPMNGVLGMIDLALQARPTPEQFEYLDLARSSAHSLLTVIGDILDFSKIEAGKLELSPVDFGLPEMLRETIGSFAPAAKSKGIRLSCEVGSSVRGYIRGDSARLRQVIVNLIGNALKFTEQGLITVRADLDEHQLDEERGDALKIRFSVMDTGIGIPADKQQLIFGAFSQADVSTTRKYGGTGLGLTISSRIVALMGGRLSVESEPGKGSCFHFTAQFAAAETAPQAMPRRGPVPDLRLAPLRLLVAEDNPVNQRLACKQLEKLGHAVTVAANGALALRLIESRPFDLVLMDVQMPEMDGLQATRLLRMKEAGSGAHLPVIALTAHAMEGDEAACLAAGMDAYVSKPIVVKALLEAMVKALASRKTPPGIDESEPGAPLVLTQVLAPDDRR